MAYLKYELQVSDLRQKTFSFYYDGNTGIVRLYEYREATRDTPRKRIYANTIKHFDMNNRRDTMPDHRIKPEDIEIPEAIKQAVINDIVSNIKFIVPKD